MNSALRNIVLLALFILGGCTPRPWSNSTTALQEESGRRLAVALYNQQHLCPPCLAADIKAIAENSFGRRGAQGYMELMVPHAFKFIVSNPLGQPLFAFAGDEKSAQLINTTERLATEGTLEEFCNAFELPKSLASSNWPLWLTARIPEEFPVAVKADRKKRGLWLFFSASKDQNEECLLVTPEKKQLLTRIIKEKERTILRLDYSYSQQNPAQPCPQPTDIVLSGLDFGTTATITISRPEHPTDCRIKRFQLPVPNGYRRESLR